MTDTKSLSTGKIQVYVITRKDYVEYGSKIRSLAFDLYHNLPDFSNDIYIIQKVQPNEDRTYQEVLEEYVTSEGSDKLIFTQAGTIYYNIPASGDVDAAIEIINDQKVDLYLSNFCNIIFNRKMAHVYGNGDYFIYSNDLAKDFIEKNTGDSVSDKIINRIVSK